MRGHMCGCGLRFRPQALVDSQPLGLSRQLLITNSQSPTPVAPPIRSANDVEESVPTVGTLHGHEIKEAFLLQQGLQRRLELNYPSPDYSTLFDCHAFAFLTRIRAPTAGLAREPMGYA